MSQRSSTICTQMTSASTSTLKSKTSNSLSNSPQLLSSALKLSSPTSSISDRTPSMILLQVINSFHPSLKYSTNADYQMMPLLLLRCSNLSDRLPLFIRKTLFTGSVAALTHHHLTIPIASLETSSEPFISSKDKVLSLPLMFPKLI
jgi:hypothetical protein